MVSGAIHSPDPAKNPIMTRAASSLAYDLVRPAQSIVAKYPTKEMRYIGRRPYFRIRGIQKRLPVPCRRAVVVKKYAIFAIAAGKPGWVGGIPVKSIVICTIATVAPAARKLHMNIARQVRIAR